MKRFKGSVALNTCRWLYNSSLGQGMFELTPVEMFVGMSAKQEDVVL
ncbi:MAG: hypothetical protein K0A90_08715 [Methanosarcinaceae archaeon]|nr:hypothetical protein [Methanosarcinaceae archaeon]